MRTSCRPAATASSTTYWIAGLSTTGSISFGVAFVAGRNRVPRPAAGMTAFDTGALMSATLMWPLLRGHCCGDAPPVPAVGLGGVQRLVGGAHQPFGTVAVARVHRGADRHGDSDVTGGGVQ